MIKYTVTELPPVPDTPEASSIAWDINETGAACGTGASHPMRWDDGTPTVIGDPAVYGYGLNDFGEVVGVTGQGHAYLFTTGGQVQDLDAALGGASSSAFAINDNGVIVGMVPYWGGRGPIRAFIYNSKGDGPPLTFDPFPGDAYALASTVNEAGDVAGMSVTGDSAQEDHAFIWREGTGVQRLGTVWSVWGLNAASVLTGMKHFAGPKTAGGFQRGNAFRLDTTTDPPVYEDLGHSPAPGYVASEGCGVNDAGVFVGRSFPDYSQYTQLPTPNVPPQKAFVRFPETSETPGFYDLEYLVVDAEGWSLDWATGINNNGQIIGFDWHAWRAFLLTPDDSLDIEPKLGEYLEEFVMMFGGASKGGAGWGLTYGGRLHPIPPHEPFIRAWRRLTSAQRDIAVANAVKRLAEVMSSAERRELIERATGEVIDRAVQELERQ